MYYEIILEKLKNYKKITSIALGGSRSRNDWSEKSDIDLFCIITCNDFNKFKNNFKSFLESIEELLLVVDSFYLENWGYLFKAIDLDGMLYDITIIPITRFDEMSIRTTNIILKDTNDFLSSKIKQANDSIYEVSYLEDKHYNDYIIMFNFEYYRFIDAKKNGDYWYMIRCLERLKNYYVRCNRIQNKVYSKSRSCPERLYHDNTNQLENIYKIDGTFLTAVNTGEKLMITFETMIENKELFNKSKLIWKRN